MFSQREIANSEAGQAILPPGMRKQPAGDIYSGTPMNILSTASRNFLSNSLFAIFFMGIFGWGLLHASGAAAGVGIIGHALLAIPGLALCGGTLYRYRRHWPVVARHYAGYGGGRRMILLRYCRTAAAVLLFASIGGVIALLAIGGNVVLLALAILVTMCVPWSRIATCRRHFILTSGSIGTVALLGTVLVGGPMHPLRYGLAAWFILTPAAGLLMLVIAVHRDRRDRMSSPAQGHGMSGGGWVRRA